MVISLMIERPTTERLFRMLIDAHGYHDAETIPVEVVFQMFTDANQELGEKVQ